MAQSKEDKGVLNNQENLDELENFDTVSNFEIKIDLVYKSLSFHIAFNKMVLLKGFVFPI